MLKAEEFVPVFKNDVIIHACGSLREFEPPDIHKVKCYNVVIQDIRKNVSQVEASDWNPLWGFFCQPIPVYVYCP